MGTFAEFLKKILTGLPGRSHDNPINGWELAIQDLVEQQKVPGLSLTVLHKGQTLIQKGYGFAHIENQIPVDPKNTVFRIASASKPIAALALATMVADGKMLLDESFYTYVPYFPEKGSDFTIRQLAGHTAGIRGYRGKEYALNNPYTIRDSLEIFKDDPLEFEPGSAYLYNSFDWVLISLAMQEVSGMPFASYVRERVLHPLEMHHTLEEIPGQLPDHTAVFYTRTVSGFRPAVPVDNRYKLAGGGYLSTSEDLAKLGQACLEASLVPPGVMQEFLTAQVIDGRSTYYGLGWQVSRDPHGRQFAGHVGNGIGGYSNFFVYPGEEVVVSILINCTDPKVQEVLDQSLGDIFLTELSI